MNIEITDRLPITVKKNTQMGRKDKALGRKPTKHKQRNASQTNKIYNQRNLGSREKSNTIYSLRNSNYRQLKKQMTPNCCGSNTVFRPH